MAKSKKRTYTYESTRGEKSITFRNFSKTYKRYKEAYYKKAKRIYKKLKRIKGEEVPRYINQRMARSVMADKDGPLPRAEFIAAYGEEKEKLLKQDSTSDPIQNLISKAAYKYSEDEYRSFVKFADYNKIFEKVSREEFRTGDYTTREDWKTFLSNEYQNKKKELEDLGLTRDEILEQARDYIQNNYFPGSQ